MRRRMILAGALGAFPVVAIAQEKKREKTLRERLQGEWSRTAHPYSFKVQGDEWSHYAEDVPFKPTGAGKITFPKDKDYAVVTTDTGHVWWLFSAGENVVAVDTFEPNGKLTPGAGRVYYRVGTRIP